MVMLIASVALLFISTVFPAQIERPITQATVDMGANAHNARAPWFFLWVQQLLKLGDPFFWGVATPVLLLILLAVLPYILPQAHESEFGRWLPRGNRFGQILMIVVTIILIILTILAITPTVQL
jgi:quinol-cytochrome oxidoreductase complex cytochrome b subunit